MESPTQPIQTQEPNSQTTLEGIIEESKLRKIAKYALWAVGGAVVGAAIGYGLSELMPATASGPYYVEQTAQNAGYMVRGGGVGAVSGLILRYIRNR